MRRILQAHKQCGYFKSRKVTRFSWNPPISLLHPNERVMSHIWMSYVTHTNKLLYTHINTLQHSATLCNTLQHSATHCNTLQHTANVTRTNKLRYTHTQVILEQWDFAVVGTCYFTVPLGVRFEPGMWTSGDTHINETCHSPGTLLYLFGICFEPGMWMSHVTTYMSHVTPVLLWGGFE